MANSTDIRSLDSIEAYAKEISDAADVISMAVSWLKKRAGEGNDRHTGEYMCNKDKGGCEEDNNHMYKDGSDSVNISDNSVLKELKDIAKPTENQNLFRLLDKELPYPLCIVEDRYSGAYSAARFLAFNMAPCFVQELPIDADDATCEDFWNGKDEDYDVNDYTIGKGATPDEALWNLIQLLQNKG